MPRLFLAALMLALAACGGGGGSTQTTTPPPPPPPAPPVVADITLLFMGNSHTDFHNVPESVAAMVRAARPGRTVHVEVAPGWMFLNARSADPATLELLQGRRWSFVVLQAQEYSSSGLFEYPIDGAVGLARRARASGAVPILFPEWPRFGVSESQRIFDLHVSIAMREPACVAPIPQAFDLSRARHPTLRLHDVDGNHSAPPGAFLAALVIAATMTGTAPDTLPFIDRPRVDADTQALLRRVAAETVLAYNPRQYCPADPL
jgi:hypothetical protein